MTETKIKGQEIVNTDHAAPYQIIDLMEALQKTVEMSQQRKGTA